ncbi:MAG: protein kinase [Candidatus Schekmanbacteria bacterium]|nr:protein kinase [Candidatus Schekmanbacteria bacterium]
MIADPLAGCPRIGAYELHGRLGAGGMGVVYRGTDVATGAAVAIKMMLDADERHQRILRREIAALARLDHPGIVAIRAHGVHESRTWYAMDLVPGLSISRHCAQLRAELPQTAAGGLGSAYVRRVAAILVDVAWTLAYLHGQGFVHRDLKPDNLLVTPEDRAVVVDFGLAEQFRVFISREALAVALRSSSGTVHYMSPEQLRGENVDARSDLYSYGCVMFELLAGKPPYAAASFSQVVEGHLARPIPVLDELATGVPQELMQVIAGLLEKHRRRRTAFAVDVAVALSRFLGLETPDQPMRACSYLYRPELCGREGELRRIESSLAAAARGHGGLVAIGGESGVGKTRLASEAVARLNVRFAAILTATCRLEGGALHAFFPLFEAIGDRRRSAGPGSLEALLGDRGAALLPFLPEDIASRCAGTTAPPEEIAPAEAKLRIFRAVAWLLAEHAEGRPLLLVIDDLQWADDLSWSTLLYLVRNPTPDAAVGLLATYRADEAEPRLADLLSESGVLSIQLERLAPADVGEVVAGMLALPAAPRSFAAHLAALSGGNPFFVAESLRAAVDAGALWRDTHGQWLVDLEGEPGSTATPQWERLALPETVRALVFRRLAALSPGAEALVRVAAVLGRELAPRALRAAAELGEDAFLLVLDELVRRHVLEESPLTGRVSFTHDKIQEMVYERLEAATRERLHRRCAEMYELQARGVPGAEEEVAEELARHWHRAGESRRALPHLHIAAQRAVARYDFATAASCFRTVIALEDAESTAGIRARIDFVHKVLIPTARSVEGTEQINAAIDAATALADEQLLADAYYTSAFVLLIRSRYADGMTAANNALGRYRALERAASTAATLNVLGNLRSEAGDFDGAMRCLDESLAIKEALGDLDGAATTIGNIGNIQYRTGNLEAALTSFGKALKIHRERNNRKMTASMLSSIAVIYYERGNLEKARELNDLALRIHRELGDRRHEGLTLTNLAGVMTLLGELDRAVDLYEQALAIKRETRHRFGEGIVLANLGSARVERGELEVGAELLRQALRIAEEIGDAEGIGFYCTQLGMVHRLADDTLEEAERLAARARTTLKDCGARLGYLQALCEQGNLAIAAGSLPAALRDEVVELAAEMGLKESDRSEVGAALRRFLAAYAAVAAGGAERLWRGEAVRLMSPGMRQWVERREQGPGR